MTHRVTVGLDGSQESRAAAEWAAGEAVLRGVPLRLVHAEEYPTTAAVPMAPEDVQQRWADALLDEVAGTLRGRHPGLEVTRLRRPGHPSAALALEGAEADVLVLGSRGLGMVAGFLIGSVGMATIAATEQPVVLVRAPASAQAHDAPAAALGEGRPAGGGGVVVGVDIHESCDAVLGFAFAEAARRGCALTAVHSWRMPSALLYPVLDPALRNDLVAEVTRSLGDMLLPYRHKFPSVDVIEKPVLGSAGEQLTAAAEGAELVVVGRRVRHAPLGQHIGHVAHAVMHHASPPVAVVAYEGQ
ncbi:universal stress protein [Streptomyces mutomycini]|uniref:Universal stress protein n=1 Tax=Streptomyces mutomycini TaxID=284036 RepID=A0ABW0B7P9_9ACTN|nr:universal stress protein [Streptomyces mutomycini]